MTRMRCVVIVFHHIVIDHLSLGQCMRELSALYLAFSEGRAPALPDPEFQFADYAVWLREHFSASDLEQKLARWRKRMDGFSGVLELPTDAPRPALQTNSGAELRFSLDPGSLDRLAHSPASKAFPFSRSCSPRWS